MFPEKNASDFDSYIILSMSLGQIIRKKRESLASTAQKYYAPPHDQPYPHQWPLPWGHPRSEAVTPYRVSSPTALEAVDLDLYDTGDISVFSTIISGF